MAVNIYESEDDIPMLSQAKQSEHCTIHREVTVSSMSRSLSYVRIVYVLLLVVYLVGTSSFPKVVVDWLEGLGYVQKIPAVVVGRDSILGKVNFLQLQYHDREGLAYVDGVLDIKKHFLLRPGMSEEARTIEVYYYNSLPDTVYPYDMDWLFYICVAMFTAIFLGVTLYAEKKGMPGCLPTTSFVDVKSFAPVTLIGVVGQVYGEPSLKNIPYMHHTTVWRSEESGNIYICKPYLVGNGISARRLAMKTKISYRGLEFLKRPECGILIKHRDRIEIVHPDSTTTANAKIFNDRRLAKLVHQNG